MTASEKLQQSIDLLRAEQYDQLEELKTELHKVQEHFRPSNIIKGAFEDLTSSVSVSGSALDSVIALGSGYIANTIVAGKSKNVGLRLLGYILQYGVTRYMADHVDGIKSNLNHLLDKLKGDKNEN